MRVRARFFASFRDAVGQRELELEVAEGATVAHVLAQLQDQYPKLAGFGRDLMVAVNTEYSGLEHPLSAGDEVAFIPPVSGGEAVLRACREAWPEWSGKEQQRTSRRARDTFW